MDLRLWRFVGDDVHIVPGIRTSYKYTPGDSRIAQSPAAPQRPTKKASLAKGRGTARRRWWDFPAPCATRSRVRVGDGLDRPGVGIRCVCCNALGCYNATGRCGHRPLRTADAPRQRPVALQQLRQYSKPGRTGSSAPTEERAEPDARRDMHGNGGSGTPYVPKLFIVHC
jgi:hypothetical protein